MLHAIPKIKPVTLLAAVATLLLIVHVYQVWPSTALRTALPSQFGMQPVPEPHNDIPCRNLPTAEDVAVILRTGATEIEDKLPAHFDTTFKCYNDLIIFSDYQEIFRGYPIHDVLAGVPESVKESHPAFDLYHRLRQHGRAGLRAEELSGSDSFEGSKSGKPDSAGWVLDKWKFLPMMRETLRLQPNKKWYVFLESDSYIVWSNLVQWIRKLDSSKALYYGNENQIGKDIYAHGGSVFVMSRLAVQKAADIYASKENEWHELTANHWAGDCVLGIALRQAGIALSWAWPMFQGGQPEKMNFADVKQGQGKTQLWCRPAMSYHHFSPSELRRMWEFEQWWIKSRFQAASKQNRIPWQGDKRDILHHKDVFREFVFPNMTTDWIEWNNLSPDLIVAGKCDYNECYSLCEDSEECLQFSIGPEGCSIGTQYFTLGQREHDYHSYWVPDRLRKWMNDLDDCDGRDDWFVT